jgi:hypothetical protein
MKPRPEFSRRPPFLDVVPDPIEEPEKFNFFSVKDNLRRIIEGKGKETCVAMNEITNDIVDVVVLSRIGLNDAVIALERAKQRVLSGEGNLLALYRSSVREIIDKK